MVSSGKAGHPVTRSGRLTSPLTPCQPRTSRWHPPPGRVIRVRARPPTPAAALQREGPHMAKIFRFDYSPYAYKVQCALDLLGRSYQIVEVPYNDRSDLLAVTGGSLSIPVFVDDDGKIIEDSRRICAHLAAGPGGELLVPPRLAGPIWAYADFCDGALEDVLFRLAAPGIRRRFATLSD